MPRIETGWTGRRSRRTVTGGVDRRTVLRGVASGVLFGRVGVGSVGASPTPTGPAVARQVDGDPGPPPAPDGAVTARSAVESLSDGLNEFLDRNLREYWTMVERAKDAGALPADIRASRIAFVGSAAAADGPHAAGPKRDYRLDTNLLPRADNRGERTRLWTDAVAHVPGDSPRDAHAVAVAWMAVDLERGPNGRRIVQSADYRDWWGADTESRSRSRPRLETPPRPIGLVTRAREEDGRRREDGLSHAISAATNVAGNFGRLDTVWRRADTAPRLRPIDPDRRDGNDPGGGDEGDGTGGTGSAGGAGGAGADGGGSDGGDGDGDRDAGGNDDREDGTGSGSGGDDGRTGALDRSADERLAAGELRPRLVATVALSPELLPGGTVARVDLGHNYLLLTDAPDGNTPILYPLGAEFDVPDWPDQRRRAAVDTGSVDEMWTAVDGKLRTVIGEIGRALGTGAPVVGATGASVASVVGASLELRRIDGSDTSDASTATRFEHAGGRYEARIVAPPGADAGYVPTLGGMIVHDGDRNGTVETGDGLTAEDRQLFDDQWARVVDVSGAGSASATVGVQVAVEGSLVDAVARASADPASPLSEPVRQSAPGDAVRVTGWYVEERADQSIAVDTGWITPAQMAWAADLVNSRADELPGQYRSLVRDGWVNVRFEAGRGNRHQSYVALVRDRRVVDVVPGSRGDAWLDASVDLAAANEIVGSSRPGRTAGIAYENDRIRIEGRGLVNRLGVGLFEVGLTITRTLSGLSRGLPFGRPERRGPAEPDTAEGQDPLYPPLG